MSTNSRIKEINHSVNFSGNAVKKVSLGKNETRNIKKVTNFMVDLVKRQRRLQRKELTDLTHARRARYSVDYPKNHLLQEVFIDVMMDGHLTGITENRTLRTTNKIYEFAIDGVRDDKLTEFIKDEEWFEYTTQNAHESIYYGGTALFVKEFENGKIKEVEIVERARVIPEHKVILKDVTDEKGIDFTDLTDLIWYAQFYNPVGLLEKASVFAILKRHSWGSWDEFEELFGIPIRIAKIASQSEVVKNEVAGWLEEMGSAPYGVFPIGTEVDIKENSKNDAFAVFYKKIEALDKEMSKLVLHQTMTTENGSSKAQGSVHENTLQEVIKADEKKMLSFLNKRVVPAMRSLGYPIPENAKIQVEKLTDPIKQIEIDEKFMSNGYELAKDYIEETYGNKIKYVPSDKQAKAKEPNNEGKP